MPVLTIGPRTNFTYDAEYHIGLVPWDSSDATCITNAQKLNLALDAMYYSGQFAFATGVSGSVLVPITFSGKTFYFRPPIKTSTRIGGALYGVGGSGYEMLDGMFMGGATGGAKTRIVGINPIGQTEPVFRIRGNGFELRGIDIYGRQMTTWDSAGPRAVACIQVEGSASRNPGRLTVSNCGLFEAQYGIQTLAGYYTDLGSYVGDENHADLSLVDNVEFFNVESCFRSENQQSLGWRFDKICYEVTGNNPPTDGIIFDLQRGGCLIADDVILNMGRVTLLRVADWSPNNNNIKISGVYRDRSSAPVATDYLTLMEYDGSYAAAPGYPWRVRIDGHIGEPDVSNYNWRRLMNLTYPSCDPGNIYVDINNLPTTHFTAIGGGPHYKWDQKHATSCWYPVIEKTGTVLNECHERTSAGTITGASWTTDKYSRTGNALSFANNTNNVSIPADTKNRPYTDSTIMFRVYLNSFVNGSILSRVGSALCGFRTEATGSKFYVSEGGGNKFDLSAYITTGAWYDIAVTLANGTLTAKCYVNGTQRGGDQTMSGGTWLSENIALKIGANSAGFYSSGVNSADMKFADLRIYDRVLSAADIAAIAAL